MSQPLSNEDDLDDLDDLLDEFADETLSKPPGSALNIKESGITEVTADSANSLENGSDNSLNGASMHGSDSTAKKVNSEPSKSASKSVNSGINSDIDADDPELSIPELDEQFAQKLKLGMDSLLKDFEGSTASSEQAANSDLEALFASIIGPKAGQSSSAAKSNTKSASTLNSTAPEAPADFQSTIAQTINRLKESKSGLDEASSNDALNTEDDLLANLMKEFGGFSGMGNGLEGILGDMLKELSSKEILYEPIKEMHEKYPGWLAKNHSKTSPEELQRYQNQLRIVSEICIKFEDPEYSDEDEQCRAYITGKMDEMQQSGAPPQELMGDITSGAIPGLGLDGLGGPGGADGAGALPADLDNCNVQ